MAPNSSRVPAIVYAENIAVLHLLHPIPIQPSSNPVTSSHYRSTGYTLSFEKERSLAGTLAFLASTRDDKDHIPAVCIEEDRSEVHLNVLLAVNKAWSNDGNQVLEELKRGFERIFSPLAQISDGSHNVEDDVLRAIVSMCSGRILHRLRLVPDRRNGTRQSIKAALLVALNYLKEINCTQIKDPELLSALSSFTERARDLLRLIDSWINHQKQHRLEELVGGIYRLRQPGNLHVLFDIIPNTVMPPTSRSHLLNMIYKVARYCESARLLYRMAKKIPLTRSLRIVLVRLPEESFDRVSGNGYVPELRNIISLISGLKKNKKIASICRLLSSTEEKVGKQFTEQTQRTLRTGKIHAEIQLLYYCKLHAATTRLLPRVVCSSKDACWLCNEFVLAYQKIHTPKTHGRLYPTWRLPALRGPEFDDLAESYNQRLQDHVKDSVKTLFWRQERTTLPEPNESTLLTLPWSESTLPTPPPLEVDNIDKEAKDVEEMVPVVSGGKPPQEEVFASSEETSETFPQAEIAAPEPPPTNKGRDNEDTSRTTSPVSPLESLRSSQSDLALECGGVKSRNVGIGKASPLYAAGPLFEVQIEYVSDPSSKTPDAEEEKKLAYDIERLMPDDVERLREHGGVHVVDAAALEGEVALTADRDGSVYISSGDTVLKINMRPVYGRLW
ncbi:hypothetical protein AAE478_008864 [Parahypoxylon ruwenzoriense]